MAIYSVRPEAYATGTPSLDDLFAENGLRLPQIGTMRFSLMRVSAGVSEKRYVDTLQLPSP
ncbi:hypothetical protein F4054_00060 [Candidatus Poribacteria bacterium]|nr:hypothetical protein [Candidatus Poribacteria bacterium]MYG07530.1 hypothetical protein [Candidatus Poribacteria bacterium]MYK20639.1 hypothetical protein [Candidatus Poribacteria bacterium]